MRAVAFERSLGVNDPAARIDVELPRPSAVGQDILVEVHAVSVNPVDNKIRGGGDPDQARVLGFDAAGTVVEVGDHVWLFQPGDEVWYAGNIARPGTNSELHLVDERIVGRKPTSLSFSDAAALPLTGITAWEGLFDKLKLTGESRGTLYVPGASGGSTLRRGAFSLPAIWPRTAALVSTIYRFVGGSTRKAADVVTTPETRRTFCRSRSIAAHGSAVTAAIVSAVESTGRHLPDSLVSLLGRAIVRCVPFDVAQIGPVGGRAVTIASGPHAVDGGLAFVHGL
jgi:hypothetical protein